jgi:hypothetical protein
MIAKISISPIHFLLFIVAATIGGFIGAGIAKRVEIAKPAESRSISAREFVVLDEVGHIAGRFGSERGETVLRMYGRDAKPALEVGINSGVGTASRFIRFLGVDGNPTASLNTISPDGETTLYLGDNRFGSRVVLGYMSSDSVGEKTNEWGLVLRKSQQPLVSLIARPSYGSEPSWAAGIRVMLPGGRFWSPP